MKMSQFSFFTAPLDYKELTGGLSLLEAASPTVTVKKVGKSILGRTIPALWWGEGEQTVLLVGAHHGMEWITGNLLMAFLQELMELYAQNDENALQFYRVLRLVVIPQLNPDGVEMALHGANPHHPLYGRQLRMNGGSTDFSHWQANARGVDLNHNYAVGFYEYKETEKQMGIFDGAPTRFSGNAPESEPETAALATYIRILRPSLILTLHTQGEEIYYDAMNATPAMHKTAKELSRKTGYTLATAEGAAAFGGLTEWAVSCKIPCYTLECGKGKNPLPITDAPLMYQRLKNALFSLPNLSIL